MVDSWDWLLIGRRCVGGTSITTTADSLLRYIRPRIPEPGSWSSESGGRDSESRALMERGVWRYFFLNFCAVRGSGDASSIFIHSQNLYLYFKWRVASFRRGHFKTNWQNHKQPDVVRFLCDVTGTGTVPVVFVLLARLQGQKTIRRLSLCS